MIDTAAAAADDIETTLPYILPLDVIWDMTIDEVIEKNNLMNLVVGNNEENDDGAVISTAVGGVVDLNYLSKMFGNQTYQSVTKTFINQYSSVLHHQLLFNRKMELTKSKLITDFMSCQLLVQIHSSDFTHITELIQKIRK